MTKSNEGANLWKEMVETNIEKFQGRRREDDREEQRGRTGKGKEGIATDMRYLL